MIVISDLPVWEVLQTYRRRWSLECSFSALKTRGLNLEATHMTAPDRISRLFGLLCMVLAWTLRIGEAEQVAMPPKRNNRGRVPESQVRVGLKLLSDAVRWGLDTFQALFLLLKTPFSSPGAVKLGSVSC